MELVHSKYLAIKEESIKGRYVVNEQLLPFLEKKKQIFVVETAGKSVQGRPIKLITLGTGTLKILMWSQMHGNESTTTKSVLDLINFLDSSSDQAKQILTNCTIKIIPMLNPDGAAAYTRVNANEIDLNRDAQERTQPESVVLRDIFDEFSPDYCFNLHDQRTIFNVGATAQPATVSFLAPAFNEERNLSKSRVESMQLIVAMNSTLQNIIAGRVGRYDDAFNANCVGDAFQMLEVPTILFEAGHSPKDYEREQTRHYIFQALLTGLTTIVEGKIGLYPEERYFEIPENGKSFYDVLIRNANILNETLEKGDAIGMLYKEVLTRNEIDFKVTVEKTGNLDQYFGHASFDCSVAADLEKLRQQPFYNLLTDNFE